MKILFITYSIKESTGVGSARSRMLYNMLLENNIDITLISDNEYTVWNILKTILTNKFDEIYFSGPPYTYYLVVTLIGSFFSKAKIFADFRDGWSLNIKNGYGKNIKPNKLKLFIAERIEKILYARATNIITCTYGMKKEYSKLFNDKSKVVEIDNGHEFSTEDYALLPSKSNDKYMNIICTGQFLAYGFERGVNIVNQINKQAENMLKKAKITFVGTDKITEEYFQKYDDLKYVKIDFVKRLPYDLVKEKIANADIGLLLLRDENIEYGTKVFDYIGLGVPIYSDFQKDKNFYSVFKKYIVEDISNIPKIKPDYTMEFSRYKQLEKLVKLLVK